MKPKSLAAILVVASFCLFSAAPASASSILTCAVSPTQIPTGIGTAALTCGSFDAGAGNVITMVQLLLAGDYLNGPTGTTTGTQVHQVYVPTAFFGTHTVDIFGGFSSSSSKTDGNINVGGGPFLAETINPGTQTFAGFTINVTSSVPAGAPVNASSVNAFVNITAGPSVPEPATMTLISGGLLMLGVFGLRKRRMS